MFENHHVSSARGAQQIGTEQLPFVFTDGHGVMAMSEFFDDLNELDEVDWEIMEAQYWADTYDDPDRKRRRQAEFLIYNRLPWYTISEIGVSNEKTQSEVQDIIRDAAHQPPINLRRNWYY